MSRKIQGPQDLSALFDAFNRHDAGAIMQFFHGDCIFFTIAGPSPQGNRVEGKSAIAEAFTAVWTAMPDARWEHHSHFVHDHRAVSEWIFSGTPREGGPHIKAAGCDLFTLRDGQIAVKQAFRKQILPAA